VSGGGGVRQCEIVVFWCYGRNARQAGSEGHGGQRLKLNQHPRGGVTGRSWRAQIRLSSAPILGRGCSRDATRGGGGVDTAAAINTAAAAATHSPLVQQTSPQLTLTCTAPVTPTAHILLLLLRLPLLLLLLVLLLPVIAFSPCQSQGHVPQGGSGQLCCRCCCCCCRVLQNVMQQIRFRVEG